MGDRRGKVKEADTHGRDQSLIEQTTLARRRGDYLTIYGRFLCLNNWPIETATGLCARRNSDVNTGVD